MLVRSECPGDYDAIGEVNRRAFGQSNEGDLVDALRRSVGFLSDLSLVADEGGEIIGHILFSKVELMLNGRETPAAALAPMSVVPERQRQRVGSSLIKEGLKRLRELSFETVFVLGHTQYYSRFGFDLALARKVDSVYSGEHFMALELRAGVLSGANSGKLTYPEAFARI